MAQLLVQLVPLPSLGQTLDEKIAIMMTLNYCMEKRGLSTEGESAQRMVDFARANGIEVSELVAIARQDKMATGMRNLQRHFGGCDNLLRQAR